jgi:hypothetical protein
VYTVTTLFDGCKLAMQVDSTGTKLARMHVQLLQAAAAGAPVLFVVIG